MHFPDSVLSCGCRDSTLGSSPTVQSKYSPLYLNTILLRISTNNVLRRCILTLSMIITGCQETRTDRPALLHFLMSLIVEEKEAAAEIILREMSIAAVTYGILVHVSFFPPLVLLLFRTCVALIFLLFFLRYRMIFNASYVTPINMR